MRKQRICVLGLGYIGLPTSAMFATHGFQVIGVDINERIVAALNAGKVTIEEPNLDILVHDAVKSGNLIAATKPQPADVFIIAVPTPITADKKADMRYVIAATESIVPYLAAGNVVILKSTSPTGTVQELMLPILNNSGLRIGKELYVGHSPERVLPGKIMHELVHNDRIIGGINRESAEAIRDLYSAFVKGNMYLTDATTAEMCKMMENTYRDVNIALANELAKLCENIGINAWEVIDLCNKHPRVNIHQPGPGVGGHCLAVDPWFIVENDPLTARIIKLARETNDSMPHHVMNNIENILSNIKGPKKVTILGITYKPDIDDMRESPIVELMHLLEQRPDYDYCFYDPHISGHLKQVGDLRKAAGNSDLILMAVNHTAFTTIDYKDLAHVMRNPNLYDMRNSVDRDLVESIGFRYHVLGESVEKVINTYKQVKEIAAVAE